MPAGEQPRLDVALSRFLDGEPEPGDGPALIEGLEQNPQLTSELRRLLLIDALLHQAVEPDPTAFAESVETRLSANDDGDRFSAVVAERIQAPPPSTRPAPARRKRWLPAAIAACVVAALGLIGLLGIAFRGQEPAPTTDPGKPDHASVRDPDGAPPPAPLPGDVVAVLANEADATFATGQGPNTGRFTRGEYQLTSGVIHLRFTSGAEIVLRSPARFSVLDPMNMVLGAGALRAIVPDSAHRFTVQAGGVRYVDLGTEFGVLVGEQPGTSRLHVFEGRVEVQTGEGQLLISVEVGQSIQVVGGRAEQVRPMPLERYPAPNSIGLEKWNRWRERFQKDRSLVCYFPFLPDAAGPTVLKDHATHGARLDGRIEGARWVTGRWPGKQALLFDQDGDHVQLSIPGSFRQLTLSTWIHLDRCDFEMNAIFDSDGWQPGALHWQLKRCGDCFFGTWSKAQRRRNGPRVPFGRWAHLAAVADMDRHWTKFYVNGELAEDVRLASSPGPLTPGDCRMGDWLHQPQATFIPRRGLRGRIDEFAIWRRALTPDEVHTLFVAGRPTLPSGD